MYTYIHIYRYECTYMHTYVDVWTCFGMYMYSYIYTYAWQHLIATNSSIILIILSIINIMHVEDILYLGPYSVHLLLQLLPGEHGSTEC